MLLLLLSQGGAATGEWVAQSPTTTTWTPVVPASLSSAILDQNGDPILDQAGDPITDSLSAFTTEWTALTPTTTTWTVQ